MAPTSQASSSNSRLIPNMVLNTSSQHMNSSHASDLVLFDGDEDTRIHRTRSESFIQERSLQTIPPFLRGVHEPIHSSAKSQH